MVNYFLELKCPASIKYLFFFESHATIQLNFVPIICMALKLGFLFNRTGKFLANSFQFFLFLLLVIPHHSFETNNL